MTDKTAVLLSDEELERYAAVSWVQAARQVYAADGYTVLLLAGD